MYIVLQNMCSRASNSTRALQASAKLQCAPRTSLVCSHQHWPAPSGALAALSLFPAAHAALAGAGAGALALEVLVREARRADHREQVRAKHPAAHDLCALSCQVAQGGACANP